MAEHEETGSEAETKRTYESASPYYKPLHREPPVIDGQAVKEGAAGDPASVGHGDPAQAPSPDASDAPAPVDPYPELSEAERQANAELAKEEIEKEQVAKEELAKDEEYGEAIPELPPPPPVSPPPPPPQRRGISAAAIFAAAIIGALTGFAGAYAARLLLDDPQNNNIASLDERLSALGSKLALDEKKIDTVSNSGRDALGTLEKRLGSVEKSANDALGVATAASAKATQAADAAKSGSSETPAAPATVVMPVVPPAPPAPDLTPLQSRLDAFEERLSKLETAVNAPKTAERATQEPESKPNPLEANAPAIVIIAENLGQKVASGAPYTTEVAALEKLGVDQTKLAALQPSAAKGVITNKVLNDDFSKLVPVLLASGKPAGPPQENVFARLMDHASGLVRVQKVGDLSGDDLPARIARVRAALARDDTDAALQEWAGFPDAAKTASAAWADSAKARVASLAAAKIMIGEAMANLTKVKS